MARLRRPRSARSRHGAGGSAERARPRRISELAPILGKPDATDVRLGRSKRVKGAEGLSSSWARRRLRPLLLVRVIVVALPASERLLREAAASRRGRCY